MDELLYFALIMLKGLSPSEPFDPPIPTPAAAAGTSSQPLAAESLPPQPTVSDVATDLEAELEPPVATPSKAKSPSKKKK